MTKISEHTFTFSKSQSIMKANIEKGMDKMKKSFASLEAPVIAGVIREKTPTGAIAAIRNGEINGATAFDLHLSCLEDQYKNEESIRKIVECTSRPMLALNYNQAYDLTPFTTTEEERIELLKVAARAGISCVDLQGYTYDLPSKDNYMGNADYSFTKGNPKEIITDETLIEKQVKLIEEFHQMGTEVLMSTHPYIPMTCEQVIDLAKFIAKRNPDIIKIITLCENDEQMVEAFKTMVELKKVITDRPIHFHCCGQAGKLTRIINPILGAYMTFCNERFTEGSNLEQLHLKTTADVISGIKKLI
jgi:3-dehydroquinate dehydratase